MWSVIGLIHDVDYEEHPDEHLRHAPDLLRGHGWPEEYIRAVASHRWGICTDVEPVTDLEKALFAIDDLTGWSPLQPSCGLRRASSIRLDSPSASQSPDPA